MLSQVLFQSSNIDLLRDKTGEIIDATKIISRKLSIVLELTPQINPIDLIVESYQQKLKNLKESIGGLHIVIKKVKCTMLDFPRMKLDIHITGAKNSLEELLQELSSESYAHELDKKFNADIVGMVFE